MIRKHILLVIVIMIAAGFLPGLKAQAVGLAVKPTKIDMLAVWGQETTKDLLVANTTNEPAAYRVYPDEYENIISVNPKDFRLLPNESQIVSLSVKARNLISRTTNISIVAQPLSGGSLKISSGVKIPLVMTVKSDFWRRSVLALLVTACLAVIFVVLLRRKSLKNSL